MGPERDIRDVISIGKLVRARNFGDRFIRQSETKF
jgi:hypothetical protein